MLEKKIIIILNIFVVALILIFSGCGKLEQKSNNTKGEIIIGNPKTTITEVEEKIPPDIASSSWEYHNEEEWIKSSVVIFRGTVTDKKELLLEEVLSDEFTNKSYASIYSFKISELYYSNDSEIKIGDTLKVLSGTTSYNWEEEAIKIEKGKEFIIFIDLLENTTKATKYTRLAKYGLNNPWTPIIQIVGDSYVIDNVFESLGSNASLSKRKIGDNRFMDVFIRSDENFIQDLMELIGKYKY